MPLTVLLQRTPGSPMPTLSFHAHVGCSRGTSRTSSGGRVKSSGGSSGAWSSRGSTSKRPFPGAQPCWIQSCGKQAEKSSRESSPLAIPHSLLQGLLSSWVFVSTGGPCPFIVKAFLALLTLRLQPIKNYRNAPPCLASHLSPQGRSPPAAPLVLFSAFDAVCPGFPILASLGAHLS